MTMAVDRDTYLGFLLTGPLLMVSWLAGELLVGWLLIHGAIRTDWQQAGAGEVLIVFAMVVWLVGWTLSGVTLIRGWLWNAFGLEVVDVKGGLITINRNLLGIHSESAYDHRKVKSLRILQVSSRSWAVIWEGQMRPTDVNCLAFDYEGRVIFLGYGVSMTCANRIVNKVMNS